MLIITKIALTFFVLSFIAVGLIGIVLCYQLIQKLNPTLRTIIYIGIITICLVTLCMNLSYMGVPYIVLYFMSFMLLGFCSIPIKIFTGDYT